MTVVLGLHASDTHLRSRLGDEEFAFEQIVDAAISHDVAYVALAGDLLDKQSNRAHVVTFFCEQIERLREHDIPVMYTQGQHDLDDPPWFSAHKNTVHMHRRTRECRGIKFYGIDWQPFGKLQQELADIPDSTDFLLMHQVWANWMGEVAAPQGSFEQIPGHISFLHTGDLHQWKLEERKNNAGGNMTVLSTGATTQQKIDEPTQHYYALFRADGSFERKRLRSRVMLDSSLLTQAAELDKFIADLPGLLTDAAREASVLKLPPALQRPYLRVSFNSNLHDTVRRVERIVKDRAIVTFKQLIPEEKRQAYARAKRTDGKAVTPLSVLDEEVNKKDLPRTYELVARLLQAPDPEIAFAQWRSEFLGEDTKKGE